VIAPERADAKITDPMEEHSDTSARSSALEAQARELYELLFATTEAMRALYGQLGEALHEAGDDSPEGLRELSRELFDGQSQVVSLALRLRVIWAEVASSSDDSTASGD
jgi:hypothetical protein